MTPASPGRDRRASALRAFAVALGLLLSAVPRIPAFAASEALYLVGDGVPFATLSETPPAEGTLGNYDPGRDALPGIVLAPTALEGVAETDPARYQRWGVAKGAFALDGPVALTLFSASDGFAADRAGTVRVGLFDCNQPGASCTPIAIQEHSADPWSPSGDWTEHTIAWSDVEYAIPAGHHLELKIVAGRASETSLLFAYGTAAYPAALTFTPASLNQPPVALDDVATVDEDDAVVIDVLANDADPDGDPLTVTAVSDAGHGEVTVAGDGTVNYTPDADWNGVDTFTYDVGDGAAVAVATVVVTVLPVNDPPAAADDEVSTAEDTTVVVDVLANDVDVDGDTLEVLRVGEPDAGTVVSSGGGLLEYTPPEDWSGRATFAYEVTDGAATDTAVVTVTVGNANDPPQAAPDAATVPEDGSVVIDVLANDFDPDGDDLSISHVTVPSAGTAEVTVDGLIAFTPPHDWSGVATFSYEVTDGRASAEATVTVTVLAGNDPPPVADISIEMAEDTTVTFDPIAEAADPDGDELVITAVGTAPHAAVELDPSGVTVIPEGDWHGVTAFTYTVSDGHTEVSATITVTVKPVNDAPVANDDRAEVAEDGTADIDVLANDFDVDGDRLSVAAVVSSGAGSALVAGDRVRYTPAPEWSGVDTVTYLVTDGRLTATAEVTVTVSPLDDAPVAVDDVAATAEDTPVTIDVLANDFDVDGDRLSIVAVGASRRGAAVVTGGLVRYTPAANATGTDVFTYTVADPAGLTATATVSVSIIAVNDAPYANPDTVVTDEDAAVRIDVLANDGDVDGDALSVTIAGPPANGSVVVNGDGTMTYTPAANWNGTEQFAYAVSDGRLTDTTPVTVTVLAVNDLPVAVADAISMFEDGWAHVDVLANDRDADGDLLVISAWAQPAHGEVSFRPGSFFYRPDPDFYGTDTFGYTVSDGRGGFAAATVVIEVVPVDDVPEVADDAASTPGGMSITIRVLGNDVDLDADGLRILTVTQGDHGAVVDNGDGTLTYHPGPGFLGFDRFLYVVTDGKTPQSAQVTVTREIDGTALVVASLTPQPPSFASPSPVPGTASVLGEEIAGTLAALAIPALATAAATGGVLVSQSETATRIAIRLGRLLLGRH